MDDAATVRRRERRRHIHDDLDRAREADPITHQQFAERPPRDQFHHDVGLPRFGLAIVVDGGDVPVRDRGDGAGLAQETRAVVLLLRPGERELDRHAATQPHVFRDIDHTHPALGDEAEDAVVRDGLPNHVLRNGVRAKVDKENRR